MCQDFQRPEHFQSHFEGFSKRFAPFLVPLLGCVLLNVTLTSTFLGELWRCLIIFKEYCLMSLVPTSLFCMKMYMSAVQIVSQFYTLQFSIFVVLQGFINCGLNPINNSSS